MFTSRLPYVSFNNLFVLPTYHMLLYGVLKKFWETACKGTRIMSTRSKALIRDRAGGMVSTNDFNSRYSCIIENHKNWKISEWLAWADVWSTFVLMDIPLDAVMPDAQDLPPTPRTYKAPSSFTEVVHRLHQSIVFFIRPQEDWSEELMMKHHADLYVYAQCMELTFGVGS